MSRTEIHQIAWAVRDGNADPENARRLMEAFVCRFTQCDNDPLLRYVRDALLIFLRGERNSLNSAFGLKRGETGRARCQDVRRQMQAFAEYFNHYESHTLIRYVCDSFAFFLNGERSLSAAFGLKRWKQRGRPKECDLRLSYALDVLKAVLDGATVEDAKDMVKKRRVKSIDTIDDAWREYRWRALDVVRVERGDGYPWSPSQRASLRRIYTYPRATQELLKRIHRGEA